MENGFLNEELPTLPACRPRQLLREIVENCSGSFWRNKTLHTLEHTLKCLPFP